MKLSINLELSSMAQAEAIMAALETYIDMETDRAKHDADEWTAADAARRRAAGPQVAPRWQVTQPGDWTVLETRPGPNAFEIVLKNGGMTATVWASGRGSRAILIVSFSSTMSPTNARAEAHRARPLRKLNAPFRWDKVRATPAGLRWLGQVECPN